MNKELKAWIEEQFPVEVIEVHNKKEKGIFKVNGEVVTMSTWKFIKEQKDKLNVQKLDDLSTGQIDWKTEKLKRANASKQELERLKQSVSESAGMIQRKNVRISELMEDNNTLVAKLNNANAEVDELTQKVEDVESSKKHLLGLYIFLSLGLAVELAVRFYSFITG